MAHSTHQGRNGPYSHRFVPDGDGRFQCRVCGLVASTPESGPGCPQGIDELRGEPLGSAAEAEAAARWLRKRIR